MEPSSLLKAWPQKSHNIISAVIQWSKQLHAQQGLREEETHFTGKESAFNAGDLGLIPGLGRSPGESILAWRIPWTV